MVNHLRPDNLFHVLTTPGATMSHTEALRALNEDEWFIRIDCINGCIKMLDGVRNIDELRVQMYTAIYALECRLNKAKEEESNA